jgi:hypothetical protein
MAARLPADERRPHVRARCGCQPARRSNIAERSGRSRGRILIRTSSPRTDFLRPGKRRRLSGRHSRADHGPVCSPAPSDNLRDNLLEHHPQPLGGQFATSGPFSRNRLRPRVKPIATSRSGRTFRAARAGPVGFRFLGARPAAGPRCRDQLVKRAVEVKRETRNSCRRGDH